jgi:RNA polymerase sigma factor (sigma-70 family)
MSIRSALAAPAIVRVTDPRDEFDRLYRDQSGPVCAMMLRLTHTGATAEDLMQETFLRAWRAYPTFRGESAPATWLHVIALRVWADWARSSGRETDVETVDEQRYLDSIRSAMPDTRVDLEAAIARLPRQMREALVLHYLHDYSVQQVGDALGKSPGTIKAQLHAAREHLRRELI